MTTHKLRLRVLEGRYAICRLDANSPIPEWARGARFISITRTAEELSIVCEQHDVPRGTRAEVGYVALMIDGPLAPDLIGVLVSLLTPLSHAGVAVFAISTFDTDYVLVRESQLEGAVSAITAAGHTVI